MKPAAERVRAIVLAASELRHAWRALDDELDASGEDVRPPVEMVERTFRARKQLEEAVDRLERDYPLARLR